MPDDHSVTVTFNPPDNTTWSFDKQKVSMNGSGKIRMSRSTTVTPAWTFATNQPNLPPGCTATVTANGAQLEIDDNGTSTNGQYVSYNITVTWNGASYSSGNAQPAPRIMADEGIGTPPMIMNQ
jgi:hypothetical protein